MCNWHVPINHSIKQGIFKLSIQRILDRIDSILLYMLESGLLLVLTFVQRTSQWFNCQWIASQNSKILQLIYFLLIGKITLVEESINQSLIDHYRWLNLNQTRVGILINLVLIITPLLLFFYFFPLLIHLNVLYKKKSREKTRKRNQIKTG